MQNTQVARELKPLVTTGRGSKAKIKGLAESVSAFPTPRSQGLPYPQTSKRLKPTLIPWNWVEEPVRSFIQILLVSGAIFSRGYLSPPGCFGVITSLTSFKHMLKVQWQNHDKKFLSPLLLTYLALKIGISSSFSGHKTSTF